MTRQTSVEAFNIIKKNGLLSRRRFEVYETLFKYGSLTAGEIGSKMAEYRSSVSTADRNIHARLSELRHLGVVFETGIRVCSITNMEVIEWAVTGVIPKHISKREKLELQIKKLKDKLEKLTGVLNKEES